MTINKNIRYLSQVIGSVCGKQVQQYNCRHSKVISYNHRVEHTIVLMQNLKLLSSEEKAKVPFRVSADDATLGL